jgi:hypothetical protein
MPSRIVRNPDLGHLGTGSATFDGPAALDRSPATTGPTPCRRGRIIEGVTALAGLAGTSPPLTCLFVGAAAPRDPESASVPWRRLCKWTAALAIARWENGAAPVLPDVVVLPDVLMLRDLAVLPDLPMLPVVPMLPDVPVLPDVEVSPLLLERPLCAPAEPLGEYRR